MSNADIDQKTRDYIDEMIKYAKSQDKEAESVRQSVMVPSVSDMKRAVFIVQKFIKDKKRIMYGGTGIHMAIKNRSFDNALYSEDDFPDYDFYSYQPIQDGLDLCNRLEDAGFQHVQLQEALHPFTYKIHVEYYPKEVADISYVPYQIYEKIPTFDYEEDDSLSQTKRSKIKVAHPEFMIVDIYRQMCNPLTGWLKIEKVVKRKVLLEKLYLPVTNNKPTFKNRASSDDFKKKREFMYQRYLIHQPDIIFSGSMVFNEFIRQSGTKRKSIISTNSLEILTENAENHINSIKKVMFKEYSSANIDVKHYQPFFQFLPPCYTITVDNDNLLTIYDISKEWKSGFPYWSFREKNSAIIKVASLYLFLQIITSKYFMFMVNGISDKAQKYQYMIQELKAAHEFWKNSQGKYSAVSMQNSPFEELPYQCLGKDIEIPSVTIRRNRVENLKNHHKYVYTYRPSEKRLDPIEEAKRIPLPALLGRLVTKNKSN